MNIDWQPNPLHTKIILDKHDKEKLLLKIRITELEELLGDAAMYLREDSFNLEEARNVVEFKNWVLDGDDSIIGQQINRSMNYSFESLTDIHMGDCTCVPLTCIKCLTEELLNINTIRGAGKHILYKIDNAFDNKNDGSVTISQWSMDAAKASDWLKAYRDSHFIEKDS